MSRLTIIIIFIWFGIQNLKANVLIFFFSKFSKILLVLFIFVLFLFLCISETCDFILFAEPLPTSSPSELTKLASEWGYDLVFTLFRGDIFLEPAFILPKAFDSLRLKLEVFKYEFSSVARVLAFENSPLFTHYSKVFPKLTPELQQRCIELFVNFDKHLDLLLQFTKRANFEPDDIKNFWQLACVLFIEFTYIKTLIFVIEELSVKQNCYCDSTAYLLLKQFINDFSVFMKSVPKAPR